MIHCSVLVGMTSKTTRLTAERLLFRPIGLRDEVTVRTFLRGIRCLACPRPLPAFACAPGELLGQVAEIAGIEIGVGPARLEAHCAHTQVFVGDLIPSMVGKKNVHSTVDFLSYMPSQALIAQRRQARQALPLEAGAQLGLAPSFLTVALMPLRQLAVEGAVAFSSRGSQEVRNPDIHPDNRRFVGGGWSNVFVHRQRQPPTTNLAGQRDAGVGCVSRHSPVVIGSEFDGNTDWLPLV